MAEPRSLVGQQFGRLTVIEGCVGRSPNGCLLWRCRCSCGNLTTKSTESLRKYKGISCGCRHHEWCLTGNARRKHGNASKLTGETTEYNTWEAMKRRCYSPNAKKYPRYGGRGITVCDRWLGKDGFANFLADMGRRPPKLTLDRIDNDGNYEPSNCRWATQKIQQNNRSDNIARRQPSGDRNSQVV